MACASLAIRKLSHHGSILIYSVQPRKGKNMCEDYPCCGHEMNDCEGQLYGSDEVIKRDMWRMMSRMADAEMGDL